MLLFDPSIDDISDVLEIRAKAFSMLKEGATVMSWGNEATNVTKQFTLPIKEVLEQTAIFLKQADPDTYGRRITRTTPKYV